MSNSATTGCFINRELSWLQFNQRVLDEASCVDNPLFERLRFAAIFSSNLDEFYMIRVGSLTDQKLLHVDAVDSRTGMSVDEQLTAIFEEVARLCRQRDSTYAILKHLLAEQQIVCCSIPSLSAEEQAFLDLYFKNEIQPLLSPQVIDSRHPFPHIKNLDLNVAVVLASDSELPLLGIIPTAYGVPRVIFLPSKNGVKYLLTEQVILHYVEQIFSMYPVLGKAIMRVTRNADIDTDAIYDEEVDYAKQLKKILRTRDKQVPVRLELSAQLPAAHLEWLLSRLHLPPTQVFVNSGPLDWSFIDTLAEALPDAQHKSLLYQPLRPQPLRAVKVGKRLMEQIERGDILLAFPFESMQPLLNLLKEAVDDSRVLSIKMCLYRLTITSSIGEYLCQAAEAGKNVTVLVELRARFDEENNIRWAHKLQESGVKVIYGSEGYKVHCKLLLITYKHGKEIRYISNIGTGNYNESTAKLYTDFSLFTADKRIGQDVAKVFNSLQLAVREDDYKHLWVAPKDFKGNLLAEIDKEINHVKNGGKGRIILKMNSLTDKQVIEKLIQASCAGVKIDLIIRGICCLRPQIAGCTENIHVISIVGRFLEHARVFAFGNGDRRRIYISSADLMTRNTTRRIEVACPIYDRKLVVRLNKMLNLQLRDNVKARRLRADGTYALKYNISTKAIDSQMEFFKEAYAQD